MNSLLGETERRFAQAFQTLEAMGPNVVFIDEIEKAFGDSSERDGGTMMRCTGALLSWLSDNPHPNYIVATSNSLRRMGEVGLTMTRSERFDAAFFVDVPGYAARRSMLANWLRGNIESPDAAAGELAGLTEKFSGADLRSVFKQALNRAAYEHRPLTLEGLKYEVERKRARALAIYDEFRELRRWGQQYCDPASATDD
jgi:SpoVK/Ycf46/Vps4 family AAA+-type ATPase